MERKIKIINSLEKAFKILSLISENGDIEIKDIRKELNLPPSTINHYLKTMKKLEIIREISKHRYSLGKGILSLKVNWLGSNTLVEVIGREMEKISKITGETTHMAVLSESSKEIIYLHTVVGSRALTMQTPVGKIGPSHATALGKVLLSEKHNIEIEQTFSHNFLQKFTENTITNIEDLIDELEKIRKAGFAVDNEESERSILCYSVPIKNNQGKTVAAISVSGFKDWLIQQDKDWIINLMKSASSKLQSNLV